MIEDQQKSAVAGVQYTMGSNIEPMPLSPMSVPMKTLLDRSASNIPRPKLTKATQPDTKPQFNDAVVTIVSGAHAAKAPRHESLEAMTSILKQ